MARTSSWPKRIPRQVREPAPKGRRPPWAGTPWAAGVERSGRKRTARGRRRRDGGIPRRSSRRMSLRAPCGPRTRRAGASGEGRSMRVRVHAQGLLDGQLELRQGLARQLLRTGHAAEHCLLLGAAGPPPPGYGPARRTRRRSPRSPCRGPRTERQHLVANLPVAEGTGLLIARVQEQAEMSGPPAARPPVGDLRVDQPVEPARGLCMTSRALGTAQDPQRIGGGVEGKGPLEEAGSIDPARCGTVRVEVEERPHGDPQAEPADPAVQVQPLPGSRRRSARSVSASTSSTAAAIRSRWKAGSSSVRQLRWKSPSVVRRPSPSGRSGRESGRPSS